MNYTCYVENFCGGVFFDAAQFSHKNATIPHFTECFLHTVLIWIPVAISFLLSPYQCYVFWTSKRFPLQWTGLLITKFVAGITAILVVTVSLIYSVTGYISEDTNVGRADILGLLLLLMALVLLQSFLIGCRLRGLVTSGAISLSYLLFMTFGLPELAIRVELIAVEGLLEKSKYVTVPAVCYIIYYFLVVLLLILSCFADKRGKYEAVGKEKQCPEHDSSLFSQVVYSWLNVLCIMGLKNPLTNDDLWLLNEEDTSKSLVKKWESHWSIREQEYRRKKEALSTRESLKGKPIATSSDTQTVNSKSPAYPSIVGCLFLCLRRIFIFSSLVRAVADSIQFINPLLLSLLLQFLSSDDEPQWKGYVYALAMFATAFVYSVILNWNWHLNVRLGMNVKTIMMSAIFKKALRLSSANRRKFTAGDILNLVSVDIQRFIDITPYVGSFWSTPMIIAIATALLYAELGVAAFAGLVFMLLLAPLNFFLSVKQRQLQFAQMRFKDARLKMVTELLNGIKVLKLYAWEESFEKHTTEIRARELSILKKFASYSAIGAFTWACTPVVVAVISFASYVLLDPVNNVLTPQRAFVSLTLINYVRAPVIMMSTVIQYMVQAVVSNERMKEFMMSEELDPEAVDRNPNQKEAVKIDNATFSWDSECKKPDLDIDMRVQPGQLVAVVGQVGAGKSSLIQAILGEMNRTSGYVGSKGRIAYVPQQAWVQNLTLRDNITFSKSYNKSTYDKVIDACALKTDLELLPGGDNTEIGDKGLNVSGGQKQRISLARAVYEDADLYLLDDPLSAVDAHVGKHIFHNVISNDGLLKRKTRIFVTHGLGYLKNVDKIFVLRNGRISEVGTYQQLMSQGGAFAELIDHYLEQKVKEAQDDISVLEEVLGDDIDQATLDRLGEMVTRNVSHSEASLAETTSSGAHNLLRLISQFSARSGSVNASADSLSPLGMKRRSISVDASKSGQRQHPANLSLSWRHMDEKSIENSQMSPVPGSRLVQEEHAETGQVKWSVYKNYVAAVGWLTGVSILGLYAGSNAFFIGSSLWLTEWSDDSLRNDTGPVELRIGVFAALGTCQALFTLAASLIAAHGMVSAGAHLHQRLLHNLLRSPASFYDVTPMGRIINRIGKDIDVVDNILPVNLRTLLLYTTMLLSILIVMMTSIPMFGLAVIPLALLYYLVQRMYIAAARQLKRLEATSRSPIYSHFQESVNGSVVIRAYQAQKRFQGESQGRVDFNNRSYYPSIVFGRWLGVRLDTIAALMVFSSAVFAVISKHVDPDGANAGASGIAVSYAMSITGALYSSIWMSCEVETNTVSIERILDYTETPTEAEWRSDEPPPSDWPQTGRVHFDNYKLRYRPGLELVLKGISCQVDGGERIGIVGRTGAGKSSLTLALFRMVEAAGGKILIDGEDISKMGLHELRSRLTIIPQDPVLFSGTLRLNLDPFESYSDQQIWAALEQSHLKEFVAQTPGKLLHGISEGGDNLSVGQRQLICLARALLRKTKLLILDEATAAVDLETDDLIQKTIRTHFADCTILTIAHRLNTILDSDRVMVLSKGEIVEFDSPANLLEDSSTVFYSMMKEAGII